MIGPSSRLSSMDVCDIVMATKCVIFLRKKSIKLKVKTAMNLEKKNGNFTMNVLYTTPLPLPLYKQSPSN